MYVPRVCPVCALLSDGNGHGCAAAAGEKEEGKGKLDSRARESFLASLAGINEEQAVGGFSRAAATSLRVKAVAGTSFERAITSLLLAPAEFPAPSLYHTRVRARAHTRNSRCVVFSENNGNRERLCLPPCACCWESGNPFRSPTLPCTVAAATTTTGSARFRRRQPVLRPPARDTGEAAGVV